MLQIHTVLARSQGKEPKYMATGDNQTAFTFSVCTSEGRLVCRLCTKNAPAVKGASIGLIKMLPRTHCLCNNWGTPAMPCNECSIAHSSERSRAKGTLATTYKCSNALASHISKAVSRVMGGHRAANSMHNQEKSLSRQMFS